MEEYGQTSSSADTKRALSIEAVLHCIENSPGPGDWILQNTIEVFACLSLGFDCLSCDSFASNIGHHAPIKNSRSYRAYSVADASKHFADYPKVSFSHYFISHLQNLNHQTEPPQPLHPHWTPQMILQSRVVFLVLSLS
jgi:hypothetical protein